MSDDWIERCERARDALFDVLQTAEPDTGMRLRLAYKELKDTIERDSSPEPLPDKERDAFENRRELRDVWRQMPWHERERLLLDVLGDDKLTIGTLVTRVCESRPDVIVYDGGMRNLVTRMLKAGELDRVGEQWRAGTTKGSTRYRYFRRTELSGPIADLNEMLIEGESDG